MHSSNAITADKLTEAVCPTCFNFDIELTETVQNLFSKTPASHYFARHIINRYVESGMVNPYDFVATQDIAQLVHDYGADMAEMVEANQDMALAEYTEGIDPDTLQDNRETIIQMVIDNRYRFVVAEMLRDAVRRTTMDPVEHTNSLYFG